MDGIITQLQMEALDSRQDVSTLLRKAYLASKKQNLIEFENWISSELNGYDANAKLPEYRTLRGVLKFHNPYHGWLPTMFEDSGMEHSLSCYSAREPIPKLIDLASHEGQIKVPLPAEFAIMLTKNSNAPALFEYAVFLDKSSIRNIVDIVRNKILDWAILLEQNGMHGEGLKFTKTEIDNAKTPSVAYYTNNFYGSVDDTQIQQGTSKSSQC